MTENLSPRSVKASPTGTGNDTWDQTVTQTWNHTWKARTLPQLPPILPARHYIYPQAVPGEEDALRRGALLVDVRPAMGSPFLLTCALGFAEPTLPSGLWSCPASEDLLVIAGGYAYRLNTAHPEAGEFLPLRPVCTILPCPRENLLLLAGFHAVLALGPRGVLWQTGRLSWEGVTLGNLEGGFLHGLGWDMFADRERPFRIDLQTGAHEGGGYDRLHHASKAPKE